MSSAHAQLDALKLARHAPYARLLLVPPAEALKDAKDLVAVAFGKIDPTPFLIWDIDAPIPYDTPGILELFYRDEYIKGCFAIEGSFSREDLALLLGTLSSGADGGFIPRQVGLYDLEEEYHIVQTSELADEDSPEDEDDSWNANYGEWHQLDRISWKEGGEADAKWSDLRMLVWQASQTGFYPGRP